MSRMTVTAHNAEARRLREALDSLDKDRARLGQDHPTTLPGRVVLAMLNATRELNEMICWETPCTHEAKLLSETLRLEDDLTREREARERAERRHSEALHVLWQVDAAHQDRPRCDCEPCTKARRLVLGDDPADAEEG